MFKDQVMKGGFVVAICYVLLSAPQVHAAIGEREFRCVPLEVYELTFDGLRMAPENIQHARTVGREFVFEEATGWKREITTEQGTKYEVINPGNLIGSPIVAQYGELNPTFLKFLMSDVNDPTKFVYFQFGGGINVFGECTASG